jgi:amino acid adenylation domain-containing protein
MTNHPGDHGIDSGTDGRPDEHGGPALTDLFERAVRATPAAPAVRYGHEVLDYAGLNARANRLAHLLLRMGVGPGCVVAVMMERSIELSVAVWGVLKAGAAYLPLDPDHPAQRIGFMLRDASSPVVLTQRRFSTRLIGIEAATVEVDADEAYFDAMPATDPTGVTGDGHLAYVLYTSGSTGQPKGCMIGHRAIVNRLQWMQRAYPIGAGDRVLQKTAYTFDVSVWEFFWPHLVGAELVHARPGGHKDSRYLADLIDDTRITVCHFVPAMLRLFLATLEPGRCGSLRHLFVSGEALPYPVMTDCLRRLPTTRLHNLYGPTEAAVDVTAWECAARDDGKVPIGRPIDNLRILIVGPDLRPVPAGEQGEICIAGVGLADGYLNRPDLTRAAFVAPPPETGESRMYRTGDLGRWLDDGLIEYCGRADGQVKLRGQRIELGEIEARILEHPHVAAAAVTVQERDSADPRLVAYVVPRAAGGAPDLAELRRFLAQTLPAAMLPNHAMTLPALPVGGHGKVDRRALPWPLPETEATPPDVPASASEPAPSAPPQLAVETGQVRAFVRTVLGKSLPGSSLDDDADLFDQGATSLTLALLAERVRSAYGCTLPIDALLDRPTVRAIAALIGEADAVASGPCAAAVAPSPQFAPQAADAGVALPRVGFAEAAYWPAAHATGLQRSPLPLQQFGSLLGALEIFQHEGRACCHYASSGGLNGVQVYAWIAEGGVQGAPAGAYYYHPEQHRLFALEAGGPTHDAFAPAARAAIDGCQFVLLLVAEFAAIAPLYQEASAPLALLEAGYMEQALRRRVARERLAVSAVHCAGFDDLRARLGLGDSHYYLHSLAVGAAAATRPDATQDAAIDRSGREALWDAGALQRGIDAPRITSSEDKQAFYARKPHLRRFPAGRAGLELPSADRSWRRLYPLRASVRHYDGGPVALKQLASALHMLAPSADGAWAYHRNAPGEPLDAWIFVRPGGVEGLGAGLYLLRPGGTLSLVRSHDEALADALELGYSPGNRKTFRRACASLFLTARRNGPAAAADVDGRCRVYLEAGAIGQALLERQAEFGLGICPIGAVIEGKLRPALGWDDDVLVVHSFLLGAHARPLPAEYQRLTADGTARGGALAVVGMDLRVPGADNLAGFWALLEQGEPRIGPPSAERAAVCGDVEGVLFPAIDRFDHLLFHVAPAEARSMDPQERALLESAWTCFEDAGYRCDRLEAGLGRLAVYVGAMWEDYLALGTCTWREDGRLQAASTLAACANRLSFFFDATGPSLTVNSACSSTLTALHLAASALHAGDADAALVGGVNLVCDRYHPALLRELGLLSPTGRARPFGQQADGWVLGEGVGTLLVRPLERALADGDRIHVVIESTVLAHTGRTSRYTAPAPQVQARALQDVLARAGLAADAVNYVEAAAPGASLADAAEYQAISAVFGPACRAGSVKGLVGHLEGASFLPQLARVLLQMRHRRLVAPAAGAAPSALVAGGEGPVLVRESCPWAPPEPGMPLRAVICANGATGSGGAVLVREPPTLPPRAATDLATPMLAVLSAPSAAQLSALLDRLRAALDIDPPPCLLDIAWTLCTGRVEHAHRIAFQVRSTAELTQALDRARAGEACPHRVSPAQQASEPGDWGETARAWLAGSGSLDALAAALRAHAPRRVGLPTLPFAGSRHWLQAGGDLLSAEHGADGPPAAPPDRDEAAIAYLRALFARVSELDPALIEPTAELARYGINSLMIAGLNAELEQDLGPGLSKALFYEHTTLEGMAAQIAARVGTRSGATACGPVVAGAGARPDSASGAVSRTQQDEAPVAVIGMAGRYPMASDLQQFWDNLVAGRDCITPLPASRRALFASAFGDAATGAWEAALAPIWGGFLEGAENFDPLYFGISPRSAELMDPQARLFLETAWETFEDAGYNREAIRGVLGRDVGVFVGVMYGEYQLYPQGSEAPTALRGQASHGSIAHQVSYHFDLHGPSLAVDTMCSASLTAVHLALAALARGECRAAIAGGVNLSVHPAKLAVQQALGMRASDGRCRSFGRGGDGFVASEGVGAVLLKPFEAACADGDHVYGLLCGSSANAGGRTHGYTVPNPNAHAALATAALARAGIASSEVGYVEAHGTGTSLGDPIEIAGLTRAFGGADGGGRQSPCAIGSVKSNIGHCESAAGIAGLTKVLLQLHHGTLTPSLHADETNPNIDFSATPFVVQRTCTPWPEPPAGAMPRTALVLSFGAGGANACVVVRTAPATRPSAALPHGPLLVALSADSPVQLRTAAQRLRTAIDRQGLGDDDLPAIAWTLRHGRELRPHRLGLRAGSIGELFAGLERAIAGAVTPAEPDAEMVRWIEHGLFGEEEVQWDGPPRRIRLPGTPFAHAPYWVDTMPTVPVHAAPPLLLRNVSSRLGFALAAELDPGAFYLRDHQVQGRSVLPGVVQLECAASAAVAYRGDAGGQLGTDYIIELSDVTWLRPVAVDEAGASLRVCMQADARGGPDAPWSYRVEAADAPGMTYSQGAARLAAPVRAPVIAVDALAGGDHGATYDTADIYACYERLGVRYGPSMRGIRTLRRATSADGRRYVVAELEAASLAPQDGFLLHPAQLDAALQCAIGLAMGGDGDGALALPFAIERLRAFAPLPSRALVWLREAAAANDQMRLDVDVCRPDGQVCIEVRGFTSRLAARQPAPAHADLPAEGGRLHELVPVWAQADAPCGSSLARAPGRRLLVASAQAGGPAPNGAALRLSAESLDTADIAAAIGDASSEPFDRIVWGLDAPAEASSFGPGLAARQQHAVVQGLRLVQALLAAGYGARPLAFHVLTRQTQRVLATEPVRCADAGAWGLLDAVAREYPQWCVRLVDIGENDDATETMRALAADTATSPPQRLARRGPHWYRQTLVPATFVAGGAPPYRDGGVYIVIGGAGGIGEAWTAHVLRRCRAQVVWLGRRAPDAALAARLQRLATLGPAPEYMQVDAADAVALRAARDTVVARHGAVHGVVHAALVLDDAAVGNLTEVRLAACLRAKLDVGAALATAFACDALDLVLFFSSVQALIAAPGQSNYAAACAAKHALAAQLQQAWPHTVVKVIHWGYWGATGAVASSAHRARMRSLGIASIGESDGMAALDRLLCSAGTEAVAFKTVDDALPPDARAELACVVLPAARAPRETPPAFAAARAVLSPAVVAEDPAHEVLLASRLLARLCALLPQPSTGAAFTRDALGIAARHSDWFEESVRVLHAHGLVNGETGTLSEVPDATALQAEWARLVGKTASEPAQRGQLGLIERMLDALPAILRGERLATEVMFPNAGMDAVQDIYRGTALSDYYNEVLATAVVELIEARLRVDPNYRFRLLEVGAGTGGTSAVLLERLRPQAASIERYAYTDLSRAFLLHAEREFAPRHPYVETALFDIERSPAEQGIDFGSFDVVVATNVLHATRDIQKTLRHAKAALRPGGWLCINEISRNTLFAHLTFGLLDGWWLARDRELRMPGSPALSPASWTHVLGACGYAPVAFPAEHAHGLGQQVIVARSDGVLFQPSRDVPAAAAEPPTPPAPVAAPPVIDETPRMSQPTRDYVSSILRDSLAEALKLPPERVQDEKAFADYGVDSIIAVSLVNLINTAAGITLPTTALFDHPSIARLTKHILDAHSPRPAAPPPAAVAAQRCVAVGAAVRTEAVPAADIAATPSTSGRYHRVTVRRPGTIDDLVLEEAPVPALGADEVRVAVHAFSLNFADLLCAKGLYPNQPAYPFTPGFDVAGVVVALGADVPMIAPGVVVGSEVVVATGPILGGHANLVTCKAVQATPKPPQLDFAQACALPTVVLTVIDAFRKAGLRQGERILIQSAAGGVGWAAMQIATHLGARIYATAGSAEKLEFLRRNGAVAAIDYLQQDFEQEIMRLTDGQGVDVVLNTLPGDALDRGLRCLAEGGRYVELAMTALKSARAVDLSVLADNQSFHSVDLRRLGMRRPERIREYWDEMLQLVDAGVIDPQLHHQVPFPEFREAYRLLEQRRNLGKVVVTIPPAWQLDAADGGTAPVRETAVAVIGMSGRFAGSEDLDAFWHHIANGHDLVTHARRWTLPTHGPDGRPWCDQGSFLDAVESFDPVFFNISGVEARFMDPQQRLCLEECWYALEDAGYAGEALSASACGVYAGYSGSDYGQLFADVPHLPAQAFWGNSGSVLASRISYFLDLHGPALAIDTACSSALVAVHLACQALRDREVDMALACSMFVQATPGFHRSANNAGMLSPTGRCHTFAAGADGFVPGEGGGAVVLRRLSDALQARDSVRAVIKGSGVNQDGATNGITAPSALSQARLQRQVYDTYGIDAGDIQLVEAHGTGTVLGDPIEIQALCRAFAVDTDRTGFSAIGSVKTNIGHTANSAGLAGLLKLLLALRHRQLPPSLHFDAPNPAIYFSATPFYVNTALAPWTPAPGKPRTCAISAFGFSGTNAHLVLVEPPAFAPRRACGEPQLLALSAESTAQLRELVQRFVAAARTDPSLSLDDVSLTLLQGRRHCRHRLAVVAATLEEALTEFSRWLEGEDACVRRDDASADTPQSALADAVVAASVARGEERRAALLALARQHVSRATIDFAPLFRGRTCGRVPLQRYPFARKRYWVDAGDTPAAAGPAPSPGAVGASRLHPLLHRALPRFDGVSFESRFDGSEPWFTEHRVQGRRLLPGTAFVEMARFAFNAASDHDFAPVAITHVEWLRPLEGMPRMQPVRIDLHAQSAGHARFSVHDGTAPYCQGEIAPGDGEACWIDLPALRGRCGLAVVEGDALYAALTDAGVDYGPSFRAVRSVQIGAAEALAEIELPDGAGDRALALHPMLLDAALHAAAPLMAQRSPSARTMLACGVDRIDVFAHCGDTAWAWIREPSGSNGLRRLDVDICDAHGNVCARIRGHTLRPLDAAALAAAHDAQGDAGTAAAEPGAHLLAPAWCALDAQPDADPAPVPLSLSLAIGAAADLPAAAQSAALRIDWNDAGDAGGLVARCLPLGIGRVVLAPPTLAGIEGEALVEAARAILLRGFALLRAFTISPFAERALQWCVHTRGAWAVTPDESPDPLHAALSGLFAVAARENAGWRVATLDVDAGAPWPAMPARSGQAGEVQALAHREGVWLRREMLPFKQARPAEHPYRQDGVYVVVGGAGGIGEQWSRALIAGYRARLVWIGRRPADAGIAAKIAGMPAGPAPLYLQADVADRDALLCAIGEVRRRYGAIHGVVHSAVGPLDDAIAHMDAHTFGRNLAAKLDGIVNLVDAVADEPLDFLLCFSSTASFSTEHGKCAYVASSLFADAYALRCGRCLPFPVKVMNWGWWGGVGVANAVSAAHRVRADRMGIAALGAEDGMRALAELLCGPLPQLAALKLSPARAAALEALPRVTVAQRTGAPVPLALHESPGLDARAAVDPAVRAAGAALERLQARLLLAILVETGALRDGVLRPEAVAAGYRDWLAASAPLLEGAGLLVREHGRLRRLDDAASTALWQQWREEQAAWASHPGLAAQLPLLEAALHALGAVLAGTVRATDVLFPGGSMAQVEGIYKHNPLADFFNRELAQLVGRHAERCLVAGGRPLRILEIGAGTGGCSAHVFARLQACGGVAEYRYTDVSPAFLQHAARHYATMCPALQTALFDIERPPAEQGIETGAYDLVIACNVLHATRDVRRTLANAKVCLATGGSLLMIEIGATTLFNHLTFGLLEGWWRFDDGQRRMPGGPALSPACWAQQLGACGFGGIEFPLQRFHYMGQQLIAAVSDGVSIGAAAARPPALQAPAAAAVAPTAVASASASASAAGTVGEIVARALQLPLEDIDPDESLDAYGLDSILVAQIARELRHHYPQATSTLLFECRTLAALATRLGPPPSAAPSSAEPQPVAGAQANGAPVVHALSAPTNVQVRHPVASRTDGRVAVIGLVGRYPRAADLHQFWDNLQAGRECFGDVPADRWPLEGFFEADPERAVLAGRSYCRTGGFIDGFAEFDAAFFRITPREAVNIDPQERLFLQTCWEAIEDAGYTRAELNRDGGRVGVYAGVTKNDYNLYGPELWAQGRDVHPHTSFSSVANRVSHFFDFRGPSMPVDTMCSASLTAVHLACRDLADDACDVAIAGGVNLYLHRTSYAALCALRMLSTDSHCRSFGAGGDGFIPGEGVGAAVLKPLADAERDGDRILAVVIGSAINHGGHTRGFTVPNPSAQADVVYQAIRRAGIDPRTLGCIEAHGTGTALGDPIEVHGLDEALRRAARDRGVEIATQSCALGSVKSNLGHAESAAGIAGFSKLVLQLHHGLLAPTLHAAEPNPEIDFTRTPLRLVQSAAAWPRPRLEIDGEAREFPRRGGVSSFGAGGANAHVVLEEYIEPSDPAASRSLAPLPALVPLSAGSAAQLRRYAEAWRAALAAGRYRDADLPRMAWTAQIGREPMRHRLAIAAHGIAGLDAALASFLAGAPSDGLHVGECEPRRGPLAALAGDGDLQRAIVRWSADGHHDKLLALWVEGFAFDWRLLHGARPPRRIGLPTYPFERVRHWLPVCDPAPRAPGGGDPMDEVLRALRDGTLTVEQAAAALDDCD